MKVYGVLIIAKNAKMEGMSEWYDSWWDKPEKAIERANHVFFKEDQDERFEKIEIIGELKGMTRGRAESKNAETA